MEVSMKSIFSLLTLLVFSASEVVADNIERVDSMIEGVTCELKQVTRKNSVLTVKFALELEASNKTGVGSRLIFSKDRPDCSYVLDEERGVKYFPLTDEKGVPIASGVSGYYLNPGERLSFWMKLPAPPEEVKRASVLITKCEPFDEVDIEDR
jgi:hypothetical protein